MDAVLCFHCHAPLAGSTLCARIGARSEPVCCMGCRAVAELIGSAGLDDFYRRRAAPARPSANADDDWNAYAAPALAAEFVTRQGEHASLALIIENLRCSACSWLIEHALTALPGVIRVSVNTASGRALLEWHWNTIGVATLLRRIAELGYVPHPLSTSSAANVQRNERRRALKQLAVAAFGMMQVMMFAVAEYAAHLNHETIDPTLTRYFRLLSMLLSLPVLFYAGRPFLTNAWHSVRTRTLGMDLPVGAALLLAFAASTWNTLRGSGEVYFDSLTMFVFFLTLSRCTALSVRHHTNSITDALAQHLPTLAQRMTAAGIETVPLHRLRSGDLVLVRSGDVVPVDGVIIAGTTQLNEAWLTGESLPVARRTGDVVSCGSINAGSPIEVRATATADATSLAGIAALLTRTQLEKPAAVRSADRYATLFLRCVLATSVVVFIGWSMIDPARALPATLAVLIVACPCAFSIALPAVLAAATAGLARRGVLVARLDALEALAHVQHVVLDKTGTLTRGELTLQRVNVLGTRSREQCLAIAASLERGSEHPIGTALRNLTSAALPVTEMVSVPGSGIVGCVNGERYRIGTPAFVAAGCNATVPLSAEQDGTSVVLLGDDRHVLAELVLADVVREDAALAVYELQRMRISSELLSGDGAAAVQAAAHRCGIATARARCTPQDKVARVQALQSQGRCVAMVGDGINDAPVLAAADVAIAMGRGAGLALAAADCIIVNEHARQIPAVIQTARRALRVARQNLRWSLTYNLSAVPLAAFGLIPPWIAALGMSASSILVLLNALRLLRRPPQLPPSS